MFPLIGLYFSFIYFGYVCRLEPGWKYKTGSNKRPSRMNALLSAALISSRSGHTRLNSPNGQRNRYWAL
jgi:hypothetical protein